MRSERYVLRLILLSFSVTASLAAEEPELGCYVEQKKVGIIVTNPDETRPVTKNGIPLEHIERIAVDDFIYLQPAGSEVRGSFLFNFFDGHVCSGVAQGRREGDEIVLRPGIVDTELVEGDESCRITISKDAGKLSVRGSTSCRRLFGCGARSSVEGTFTAPRISNERCRALERDLE